MQKLFVLKTSVNHLKNLRRAHSMGMGLVIQADGTHSVTWSGHPVLFFGVTDMAQSFHMVGSSLQNSENTDQILDALLTLLEFANIIQQEESLELLAYDYGLADNSDAFQSAYEQLNAWVLNCKVHMGRNVKNGTLVTTDKKRTEVVREIRSDMARMTDVTVFNGMQKDEGEGCIAEVVQDLFYQKWLKTQPEWARVWSKEYTGERKGGHMKAHSNPGLPVHSNGVERFNLTFKEDGRCTPVLWHLACFSPSCRLMCISTRKPFVAQERITRYFRSMEKTASWRDGAPSCATTRGSTLTSPSRRQLSSTTGARRRWS